MPVRRRTARGFTMLEVLIAFAILAVSLAAVFGVFSDSLRAARLGEDYAHATAVAWSRLAAIDGDVLAGPLADGGETEAGFRWEVTVAEMPDPPMAAGPDGLLPAEVKITVSWGTVSPRSVELVAYRAMQR